jgi:pilus assembly protein CpaF
MMENNKLPTKPSYKGSIVEEASTEELPEDVQAEIDSLPLIAKESAAKLYDLIAEEGITEILMNGPDQVLFRKDGQRYFVDNIIFPDVETYHKVINCVILPLCKTNDRIGKNDYLIEGQLEMADPYDEKNVLYARVHIVAPPAVSVAKVTIAKKSRYQYKIDDILTRGSMNKNMSSFLKAIARSRVTTVFSGLSGSGKTTLLEAMSFEFDANDRVIVVEETPELRLPIQDAVYLPAHGIRPGQSHRNTVSVEWLAAQANRMRPDRIIVGECRGFEMGEFINAANSGADGSMTTIHASSPRQALDKMVSLCLKADDSKSEMTILRDIASTVQLVIQTNLVEGRHVISQIEEVSNTIRKEGAAIATTTLFEYDRSNDVYVAKSRPSEQLVAYMASRGVKVDLNWFKF